MPDRELYYKYKFLRDMPMKRFIASVGCPYPCTFCHEPVIRSLYKQETKSDYLRRKSVRRIVDADQIHQNRYPLKHVHFSDDLLFIRNNYKWLEEFAEVYPREVGIPWNCNIRYDSVREHAADLLEKAMCHGAAVGLESGNQEIREVVIRKQSKNEHIVEGARLLRAKGIKVLTTNMVGLPGETLDNALETVELNMVLKSNYVRANTFLLFPVCRWSNTPSRRAISTKISTWRSTWRRRRRSTSRRRSIGNSETSRHCSGSWSNFRRAGFRSSSGSWRCPTTCCSA